MKWKSFGFVVISALILTSGFAHPENRFWHDDREQRREAIIGQDDRKPTDSWDEPWNAIGEVYYPNLLLRHIKSCTGTLVDPQIVVTAAHCLFDQETGKAAPPSEIHFLAAKKREKHLGHGVGKCVKVPAKYKYQGEKTSLEMARLDYAFVVLEKPLNISPVPIYHNDRIEKNATLVHAGYGADRPYLLSVHENCSTFYEERGLYYTDCDTQSGQSGGPIFVKTDGRYFIAAVMSCSGKCEVLESPKASNYVTSILGYRDKLEQIRSCE